MTRTVTELYAERAAIWDSRIGLPDKLYDAAVHLADELEVVALETPCLDVSDLSLKMDLWNRLVEDPACIMDGHVLLWDRLKADIWRVLDQEAYVLHGTKCNTRQSLKTLVFLRNVLQRS